MAQLVPFNAKSLFTQKAKALKRRHFVFGQVEASVAQNWRDDGKGGTEIGFGACVYEASYVLADYLCRNPAIVAGRRVVELGSGVGLLSVICSKLGASHVFATDGDMTSVELSRKNLSDNNCGKTESICLLWGNDTQCEYVRKEGVDIIVASDIVACPYVKAFDDLVKTIQVLTSPSVKAGGGDTALLLCYKPRGQCEEDFFSKLKYVGFTLQSVPMDQLHPDYVNSDLQIIKIQKAT